MYQQNDDVIYIGADVHERETQLAIFEPRGTLLQENRILTKDLASFVRSLQAREKHLALESVGFIYPLYDKLKEIPRCEVAVANPKRLRADSGSRQKHDRIDAKVLGNLIRTNFLKRSYMPEEETREKRFLINDRVKYGLRRGELRGSIRWLLKRRGIVVESPFSVEGRRKLREEISLQEIDMRLQELDLVESIVEKLDRQISSIVAHDDKAKLLDTLPGVAPYTALFLSSSLDSIDRFHDSKHACAYLGLVPSLHQSGDASFTGHITRDGNKFLRRNLVECARVAVRKDPHLREFYLKLKHKRGERKALIAVARKIVSYAYWMLKRNQTYEELAPWTGARGSSPSPE
jgi:transposase